MRMSGFISCAIKIEFCRIIRELALERIFKVAATVEAAHLLSGVASQARVMDIEQQRTVALQPADILAFA